MTLILTGVVLIAFLTGLAIGTCRGHKDRETLRSACRKLIDSNAELRAELVTALYRPISDVEPVSPEIAERVLAEHFSAYDPRYHSTENR